MDWLKLYAEWAFDPKVQSMPENFQRRHAMLMCYHKAGMMPGLTDSDLAKGMRISPKELSKTKAEFVARGFINETWRLLKWDKRQGGMSESKERVQRHRERYRNVTVALPKRDGNVTVTRAPAPSREEIRGEEIRGEGGPPTPNEQPPPPIHFSSTSSNPENAPIIQAALDRWGAANGDTIVGDMLREFPPAFVKAACDAAFDKFGSQFKPSYIRATCRGYWRDGGPAAPPTNGPMAERAEAEVAEAKNAAIAAKVRAAMKAQGEPRA